MPLTPPPQVINLRLAKTNAMTERDFYFAKLRSIQLILEENETDRGDPTLQKILVLCATDVSHHASMRTSQYYLNHGLTWRGHV